MLTDLMVEGLGVIDHAEVTFAQGSSAITGETGAGKTLVVAAVGLLLGDRAEKVMVRQGAQQARVQGRFVLPRDHAAIKALIARELVEPPDGDEVELILARTVRPTRAATARVNDQLVTAAVLTEIAPDLVEIAGQHEHGRISDPVWQRRTLDEFGGAESVELAGRVSDHWREASRARRRLDELTSSQRARERELDLVRFEVSEIEDARIEPGEEEQLTTDARRLEQAEAIERSVGSALDSLKGDDGVIDRLSGAGHEVGSIANDETLAELRERIEQAQLEVSDIASELSRLLIAPDPSALEAIRDRLGVFARLKRKYGESMAEVLRYLDDAKTRRAELESAGEDSARWAAAAESAEVAARKGAEELSQQRAKSAAVLQAEVTNLLGDLALAGATFEVRLIDRDLYEGGLETVEFLVAANPGEKPRPVAKVASGGELSRIALALHLLTSSLTAPTTIFDEVDAGVGGEAAQAVGRALAQLGRGSNKQVIIVTHLPQVAAFSDAQYRVIKETEDERARASVERVEGDRRIAELSRMLAGLPDSERAHQHAQELLDLAAKSEATA